MVRRAANARASHQIEQDNRFRLLLSTYPRPTSIWSAPVRSRWLASERTVAPAPRVTLPKRRFSSRPTERSRSTKRFRTRVSPTRLQMTRCSVQIDADDFRINGNSASDYTTLTQEGLIRVTLPLPGNVRLVSPVGDPATAPLTSDHGRHLASGSEYIQRSDPRTRRTAAGVGDSLAEPARWVSARRSERDASRSSARRAHRPRGDHDSAAAEFPRRPRRLPEHQILVASHRTTRQRD